jgi:hypothetical protein
MNELRKQIETERGSFVARELYDREHSHLVTEIQSLRESRAEGCGEKSLLDWLWPMLFAIGMFVVGHLWK